MLHYVFAGEHRNVYVSELVDDVLGPRGYFTCMIDEREYDAKTWDVMTRVIDGVLDSGRR